MSKKNNDVYYNSCIPDFLLQKQISIFTQKIYIENELIDLKDEYGVKITTTLSYKMQEQAIKWADFKILFLHNIIQLYIKLFCNKK